MCMACALDIIVKLFSLSLFYELVIQLQVDICILDTILMLGLTGVVQVLLYVEVTLDIDLDLMKYKPRVPLFLVLCYINLNSKHHKFMIFCQLLIISISTFIKF